MERLKIVYLILVFLYAGIIAAWFARYPISYRIIGVNPDVVEERSLTTTEEDALQDAVKIRQLISQVFFYASVVILVISFIIHRNQWFGPAWLLKIMMIISALFALMIWLAKNIHFIPGPPIR